MKLVEIKDVRVGQIRKNFNDIILIDAKIPDGFSHYQAFTEFGGLMNKDIKLNHKFLDMPIIGKLGITHRIDDGRLVKIPRAEGFQVDDVVKFNWNDPRLYVINREIDFGIKKTHPDNSCFEATNDCMAAVSWWILSLNASVFSALPMNLSTIGRQNNEFNG